MSQTPPRKRQPKSHRRAARQDSARKRARQRQLLMWVGGAIGLAVILVAALVLINRDDEEAPIVDPAESAAMFADLQTDGQFLGDPEAPVTLVVYSDFQCPVCKRFDTQDLPSVIESFVRTGDVRIEWRPMPIISGFENIPLDSPDNESVQSGEAAMCAADQDQFWPYSEALFAAQEAENSGVFTDDMLKQTAADLGLDTETFNTCLDSGEKQQDVLDIRQDARDRGVNGTPTFLINDQLISYTREGFDRLAQQLNDALDGKQVEN